MLIGYMRPCQDDLNCQGQLKKLKELNCRTILSEDHALAKKRFQLEKAFDLLSAGDALVIEKLYILGDSTRHLAELLEELHKKGAFLISIVEGIDTRVDEMSTHLTSTVKHIVAFQSDIISEKTKEGLQEARQKGSVPGRPRKSDENVRRAIAMYQSNKFSLSEIKEHTGISKSTLYRYLESYDT